VPWFRLKLAVCLYPLMDWPGKDNRRDGLYPARGIVDYIGLGTFRKTRTKPEITEFLSLEEIGRLVDNMERMDGPRIPLLVIGGVRIDDIPSLLSVGVHGIAIASLINEGPDKSRTYVDVLKAFS